MNVYAGNFGRIRQTAALAEELGADTFSFAPVIQVGRASERSELVLSVEQILKFPELVEDLERAHPHFIKVTPETPGAVGQPDGNCGAGWRALTVGPSGHTRICNMLGEEHGRFGNLFEFLGC